MKSLEEIILASSIETMFQMYNRDYRFESIDITRTLQSIQNNIQKGFTQRVYLYLK